MHGAGMCALVRNTPLAQAWARPSPRLALGRLHHFGHRVGRSGRVGAGKNQVCICIRSRRRGALVFTTLPKG